MQDHGEAVSQESQDAWMREHQSWAFRTVATDDPSAGSCSDAGTPLEAPPPVPRVWRRGWNVLAWPWRQGVEPCLDRWLVWWHGRGEAHQYQYYRCHGCRWLVSWHAIRKGGCTCGVSTRLSPARLTSWEMVRLVVLPFWGVRL